jgi:hypothetical protein
VSIYDVKGRLVRRLYDGANDGALHIEEMSAAEGAAALPSPGVYSIPPTLNGDATRTEKAVLTR